MPYAAFLPSVMRDIVTAWDGFDLDRLCDHLREDAVLSSRAAKDGSGARIDWLYGSHEIKAHFERFREADRKMRVIDVFAGTSFYCLHVSNGRRSYVAQVELDESNKIRRIIICASVKNPDGGGRPVAAQASMRMGDANGVRVAQPCNFSPKLAGAP